MHRASPADPLVAAFMAIAFIPAAFAETPATAPAEPPAAVSPPPFTQPGPATRPVGVALENIIKGILVNENGFRFVHVRGFDLTHASLAADRTTWTPDAWQMAGSAWYEFPGDRCRIYFRSQVLHTYAAQDVTVNDPDFDTAIFKLRFAPGYVVNSGVGNGGDTYVVREDGTTRPSPPGTPLTERVGQHQVPEEP